MRIWILLFITLITTTKVFAECNFVTAKYIEEMNNPSQIRSINIKVSDSKKFYKNSFKIASSNVKTILPKFKKKFIAIVKVEYSFGLCSYRANVRQSGDGKDHIKLEKGGKFLQSLDVNLNNGNIVNATKFKLFIPKTRNYKSEILAALIFRELNFIGPETFEVNANINGTQAVMIFQEKPRKELLERNFRREGPIFEGDESILWSYKDYGNFELVPLALSRLINHKWFNKNSSSQKISLEAFMILQKSFLDYQYNYHIFNRDVATVFFPNPRSNNIFANFNFTLFAMNGEHGMSVIQRNYHYNLIDGYFEPIYYDGNVSFDPWIKEKYIHGLFRNELSNDFFERALQLASSSPLKKKFLERTKFDSINETFFHESMNQLKINFVKLNNAINEAVNNSANNIFQTQKKNQHYSWYKNFQNKKKMDQTIITQINLGNLITNLHLDNNTSIDIATNDLSKILSKNKLNKKRHVIFPHITRYKEQYNDINIGNKIIRTSKNLEVKFNLLNKKIEFIQSNSKDWALLLGGDYSNWNIVFKGKKSQNILTDSVAERFNTFGLTGCLTLYKTIINRTQITSNNGECEDSVNFISSNGKDIVISVNDSFADAIDADFSMLNIDNLEVFNAGNDCFDASSGNYVVRNAKLINCKDKAISIGEKSIFKGNEVSINKAKIGISSKDFSQTAIDNLRLKNVILCGESKRKKQEFGGAILSIISNNCINSFENDKNSILIN